MCAFSMPLAGALQPASYCVRMSRSLGRTQVSWEGTGNLVVNGRKHIIISQNWKICTGLQKEQGGKSSITFIKKHPSSACFLLKSVKVLRPFLLFSPVYFANSNRLQIIVFLSPHDSYLPSEIPPKIKLKKTKGEDKSYLLTAFFNF